MSATSPRRLDPISQREVEAGNSVATELAACDVADVVKAITRRARQPSPPAVSGVGADHADAKTPPVHVTWIPRVRQATDATTVERWTPTLYASPDVTAFENLPSVCPNPRYAAANRHDPYWDDLFDTHNNGKWLSASQARRQIQQRPHPLPKALRGTKREGLRTLLSRKYRETGVAVLGALHGWRTLSLEQLAALIGSPSVANGYGEVMASAFAAELIDIGHYVDGWARMQMRQRAGLVQPANSSTFARRVLPILSEDEWLSITTGQRWTTRGLYDRHNILATELGLRLAEFAPVGTVLSERLSTFDHLAGTGIGRESLTKTNRSADLTVVRPDGMRIAIELVASISPTFKKKAASWARLLQARPFETSGLCVMFVCVGDSYRPGADTVPGRAKVYRAVLEAVNQFHGTASDLVAERIGVTSWREWFPSPKTAHEGFTAMRADAPVNHLRRYQLYSDPSALTADDLWRQLDFLDPESRPFQPASSFDATAIIDEARLLGQTPVWLR